jgi:hypothetical protein
MKRHLVLNIKIETDETSHDKGMLTQVNDYSGEFHMATEKQNIII